MCLFFCCMRTQTGWRACYFLKSVSSVYTQNCLFTIILSKRGHFTLKMDMVSSQHQMSLLLPFCLSDQSEHVKVPNEESTHRSGSLHLLTYAMKEGRKKTRSPASISRSFSAAWILNPEGCWRGLSGAGSWEHNRYAPHTWVSGSLSPLPALLYLCIMRSLPGSSSNFIQTLIFFEEKKIAYKRVCDANSIRRAVDGKLFKCEPEQGGK